jgi:hypothetical protein
MLQRKHPLPLSPFSAVHEVGFSWLFSARSSEFGYEFEGVKIRVK